MALGSFKVSTKDNNKLINFIIMFYLKNIELKASFSSVCYLERKPSSEAKKKME